MTLMTKVMALLSSIRRQEIEDLPPFQRQRLCDLCLFVAGLASQIQVDKTKEVKCIGNGGVLLELDRHKRES